MKKINFILPFMILLLVVLGCDKTSEIETEKSGRLQFVKKLRYGSVGTHGSQGWYVNDRYFKINDKDWSPDGIKVEDISNCEASPNEVVEALKCTSFAGAKEEWFILRMKGEQPEWITAPATGGEWVGDGRWLLFTDFYFNVETSEQRKIKALPGSPKDYFRAASPDMKTIIYEVGCYRTRKELPPSEKTRQDEFQKQCELGNEYSRTGVLAFWLIEAASGDLKLLKLQKEKYPDFSSVFRLSDRNLIKIFQKMLVWEKDKNGKDRLVYPN